jgi:hypothetical protein
MWVEAGICGFMWFYMGFFELRFLIGAQQGHRRIGVKKLLRLGPVWSVLVGITRFYSSDSSAVQQNILA